MPAIVPLASKAFNLVVAFLSGIVISSVWQSSDIALWTPSFQPHPTWYSFIPKPAKTVLGLPPPPDLTWDQPPKHTQWLYGEYCELVPYGEMHEAMLENVSSMGHSEDYAFFLENLDPGNDLLVCPVPPELSRWQIFFSYLQYVFHNTFHSVAQFLDKFHRMFWIICFTATLYFIHRRIVQKMVKNMLPFVETFNQLHNELLSEQEAHIELLRQYISTEEQFGNTRRALERSVADLEAMRTLAETQKTSFEQEQLQKDRDHKLICESQEQSQKDADQKFTHECNEHSHTQEQLASALTRCKDLEEELHKQQQRHEEQSRLYQTFKDQNEELDAQLRQARTDRAELREELDDQIHKLQDLDLALADTQQDLETAQTRAGRMDDLEAELRNSRDEVAQLAYERTDSTDRIIELTQEVANSSRALQDAQSTLLRVSQLESQLAKSLETEVDLRGKLESYKNVEQALDAKVIELKCEIDNLKKEHNVETERKQGNLAVVKAERDRIQSELTRNQEELSQVKANHDRLMSKEETSLAEIADLQSKIDAQAVELQQHRVNTPKLLKERNDMFSEKALALQRLGRERQKLARLSVQNNDTSSEADAEISSQASALVDDAAEDDATQDDVHRRRRRRKPKKTHPLCDRCRESKLKCDRKSTCALCNEAGVPCTRLDVC